ncbi:plasma membrane snare protein [Niveomyces insectorum RCEF 264]|uniref:Plasma membrane snare protein n=1 Tax=Niveomyces insectorum RCEF 264 TaxID=1081102 RepID=A0A162JG53_9HYPO|nr:plasma membrane snare protein [Niveomyces insectorum RCEF 264]
MGRFGFSKEDEDGNRSRLFGRKKSNNGDENPYAQQSQQSDPYSAPMTALQKQQAAMGLPAGPRAGRPGLPSGPGPRGGAAGLPARPGVNEPQSNYGNPSQQQQPPSNGYSAGGYGAQGGYGGSRYDNSAPSYGNGPPLGRPPTYRSTADSDAAGPSPGGSSYGNGGPRAGARRGGYGGMGGNDDDDDDAGRHALFGDAPKKYAQLQRQEYDINKGDKGGAGGGGSGGGGASDGFDGYGDTRELTAEEQEDEDVKRMNQETRYLRNETDQSLDRSLMIANQAIETSRSTLARMHHQRDRLFNAEQNLDSAANHNKIAEHRAAELKHYNRSMFAVKVNNPFTSKQRAAEQAQAAIDEHRAEREQREETRRIAYASNRNAEENFSQLDKTLNSSSRLGKPRTGLSSKFNLEDDDEEDIQKEQQIDMKIGLLEGAVSSLNMTARSMNEFATEDIEHIDRIAAKSDQVDDGVRANRYRLERIEKGR